MSLIKLKKYHKDVAENEEKNKKQMEKENGF